MNRDDASPIQSRPVALGVLLDGPIQQGWVLESLRQALEVPGVQLTAIALVRGIARNNSVASRLHRMLDRIDRQLRCRDERLFATADLTTQLAVPHVDIDVVREGS